MTYRVLSSVPGGMNECNPLGFNYLDQLSPCPQLAG